MAPLDVKCFTLTPIGCALLSLWLIQGSSPAMGAHLKCPAHATLYWQRARSSTAGSEPELEGSLGLRGVRDMVHLSGLHDRLWSCTEGSAKALEERGHGMRVISTSPEDAHHAPRQA